ncbi:helix-turn-helix domain-containing protein [Brevibacterium spongiae]|uniref:Helix-turn-helix domain-containing protein n=1 Tax=Brevibacterium spongiae TaxID=2909672 RepID=A0ABY5SMS8_9MICO|nr:helix-turn-helix domain-containing protein [Brevibacterium spongiae]UVI35231.1 helix-turn-helix domain-containing protein [Brevibacterium spongiae]
MAEAIAHEKADELRAAIDEMFAELQDSSAASVVAHNAFLRLVDVLESSSDVVVLPSNKLVSTQQAADLLGVSRMTVVRLIERGEITTQGGGLHRRIPADELARYQSTSSARRRTVIREFAAEIDENTPPDEIIQTR